MLNPLSELSRPKSDQILDVAETLVRQYGYNRFSYSQIAKQLDISKSSMHHYYPTKADLGLAMINRFNSSVIQLMNYLHASEHDPAERLKKYFNVYLQSLSENKMCLCGMMAAEHESLSSQMQAAINAFFLEHIDWLEVVLREGRFSGRFEFQGEPRRHAQMIHSCMQGGLMVAKAKQSSANLESLVDHLLILYSAQSRRRLAEDLTEPPDN